jgi:hypothetical protein
MFIILTKSLCKARIPVNIEAIDTIERRIITLPNAGGSKEVTRMQMRSGHFIDVTESVGYIQQFLPMAEALRAMPV